LTALPGSPFAAGSGPQGVAVSPDGAHLYVTNFVSNTVSGFSIGPGGGLTALPGSPFPAGSNPVAVAISPSCQDPAGAYNQGFTPGFNSGLNSGFNSGFQRGFTGGFGSTATHARPGSPSLATARRNASRARALLPACNPVFNQGFNRAFNVGFNSASQRGFNSGNASELNAGFRARHHRGHH
jgi:hypothetical protein